MKENIILNYKPFSIKSPRFRTKYTYNNIIQIIYIFTLMELMLKMAKQFN